jgi:glycosyltransferase involved in cell wall biosynthesis
MRTHRKMRDLYRVERQGLTEGIRLAKPDVLHAHWTYEFALACLETGLPMLVTAHDNAFRVLRFTRDLYRLGRLYLQIRVIKTARLLTAVSPYLAESLSWLAGTDIKVVPNPVLVPQDFGSVCDRMRGDVRIATVLNGWQNLKNPKGAIRAFHLLRGEVPDAHMFMYGYDFEEGGPASEWAIQNNLNQNIHFCGFLGPEELQRNLQKASILLHPSLEESFGMTIVEAIALGLSVVGGISSGAVPWLLDGGKAGFLTNVKDPKKIFRTLLSCIEQEEARNEKRRNAQDRVVNLFSPNSVAEQYENVYQKALSLN